MLISERTQKILKVISEGLYERDEAISLAFLSAVAGESVFMLGPPGVAKSMVSRRLKYAFAEGETFEYLMNRFSTPDEIFGPISISKLSQEDKYERMVDRYLPGATVVFLDEIWKAGPAIQNALLTVINEKLYRNGDQEIKVKLQGLISASNELPERGEGLEALWDRFLVRCYVDRILDEEHFFEMITESTEKEIMLDTEIQLTESELAAWSLEIDQIIVPQEVLKVISSVRKYIERYNDAQGYDINTSIYVSDRRWRKIIRLLRTSAYLNGRKEVALSDCCLMSYCIWSTPDHIEQVKKWVVDGINRHGWRSKFNLRTVKEQIEIWKKDVDHYTKEAKELVGDLPVIVDKKYYKLEEFGSSHNRILIDDYNALTGGAVDCKLYTPSGRAEMYVLSKLSDSEVEVLVGNNYQKIRLKTGRGKRDGFVKVTPETMVKQQLNEDADKIIDYLDEVAVEIESNIEKYRTGVLEHHFVTDDWFKLLEEGVMESLHKVVNWKMDVQKTKKQYGG